MPFEQTCPGCGATFELADKLAGKSLRCQECNQVFLADVAESPPSKPAARKRAAPPVKQSSGFGWLSIVLGLFIVAFGLTCGVSIVLIAAMFVPATKPVPIVERDHKE